MMIVTCNHISNNNVNKSSGCNDIWFIFKNRIYISECVGFVLSKPCFMYVIVP